MRKRHEVDAATRAELEKWKLMFDCGYDFFDETGFDPHPQEPPHGNLVGAALEAAEARFLAAMYDAWQRCGRLFLGAPKGPLDEKVSFALFAFGQPEKPRRPRRSLAELRSAHFEEYPPWDAS